MYSFLWIETGHETYSRFFVINAEKPDVKFMLHGVRKSQEDDDFWFYSNKNVK